MMASYSKGLFGKWTQEFTEMGTSSQIAMVESKVPRKRRSNILYADFKILTYLKCEYGDIKSKLANVDRAITDKIFEAIARISKTKAIPIRNYIKNKKTIKTHEINGGRKTGVCYKGSKCKCTDDSETVVETNQKLRTAYRSNQNLCTLKSCSTGNLDEIVTDTIISVNKLKDEDFT